MSNGRTLEEMERECTHNCMSCGLACNGEEKDLSDKVTLEKALYSVSELDEAELLRALDEF